MDVMKYFANQRGVKGFSFCGLTLPTDMAMEADQLAPLIVASAAYTFHQSGLFEQKQPFPWTLASDESNEAALIDGATIERQPTVVPDSVGYLFLDHEIEELVIKHKQEMIENEGILPMDSIVQKLEMIENEPEPTKRVPFDLSA